MAALPTPDQPVPAEAVGEPGTSPGLAPAEVLRKSLIFLLLVGAAVAWIALTDGDVSWPGLVSMLFFYGLFYYLGAILARRKGHGTLVDTIVAGRGLPLKVAVFTMTATWVDGAYISGSAEAVYANGLVWAQAPWGYALSLILGGVFFARRMRRGRFLTMIDPIDVRFGRGVAGASVVPALVAEIFWTGAILTALGTTFATIVGVDFATAIVLSAAIAVAYTVVGGMWSVALTDVAQIGIVMVGLAVVLPYAFASVGGFSLSWQAYSEGMGAYAALFPPLTGWDDPQWGPLWWNWWDFGLLLVMGGIPWQVYFQRVLSAKDENTARWLSIGAGLLVMLAAVPPVLIGIAAYSMDFEALGAPPLENPAMVMPYVLRYAVPGLIAAIGLGTLAAAVMSSVDSSILSASSLGGWNVYRRLVRPRASAAQVQRVVKRLIVIVGAAGALLALNVSSVYQLWYLSADLVYVLLFPQLVCALFVPFANRTGAVAGFALAAFLRLGGGEPTFGLPSFLPYPWEVDGAVLFPFRTLAMVCGLLTILGVSYLTRRIDLPVPMTALDPASPQRRAAVQMESAA